MKRYIFSLFIILFTFYSATQAFAVYDPTSVPNNKIGIHILFPSELQKAAELVNSSGGDWGYVTIPIQAGDKDIEKWQSFMDDCRRFHLIPILRLATEGDYFDKTTWRKPKDSDVLDFANFLSSLDWPVKNRYIIVFNEVNRADEWNGLADPQEYAELLSFTVTTFKEKSPDFFIISAGLDNAAANSNGSYNEYDFFRSMNVFSPGIFNQIDGIASHSYPNPGFSSLPRTKTPQSTYSFSYEEANIESIAGKKLPVFITETGWTQEKYSPAVIGGFFKDAFSNNWNDPNIIAVTPFLLNSGSGPFEKFSFIKADGNPNDLFNAYKSLQKSPGKPNLYPSRILRILKEVFVPTKNFTPVTNSKERLIKDAVKWLFFGF